MRMHRVHTPKCVASVCNVFSRALNEIQAKARTKLVRFCAGTHKLHEVRPTLNGFTQLNSNLLAGIVAGSN